MKPLKVAALLAALAGATHNAHAQSSSPDLSGGSIDAAAPVGKAAGTFMIRLRAIGVIPENMSSSVSAIGGSVHVTNQAAPELDLSYFLTDHIAAEVIAASTRHEVYASGTALGRVDVGSTYVLPPTVTLQYHFWPHRRLSPYVGAGLALGFFYDSNPAGPTVKSVGFKNNAGGAIQAGIDYNVAGHWFINADVKQIFLDTTARINGGAIVAKTDLDPTVVGVGIGYRF